MALRKDRLVTAKYLNNWTLVRLPDGQVGVLTKLGGGCRITFAARSGVAVDPDTEIEVIKHPAELAMEALMSYDADGKNNP